MVTRPSTTAQLSDEYSDKLDVIITKLDTSIHPVSGVDAWIAGPSFNQDVKWLAPELYKLYKAAGWKYVTIYTTGKRRVMYSNVEYRMYLSNDQPPLQPEPGNNDANVTFVYGDPLEYKKSTGVFLFAGACLLAIALMGLMGLKYSGII